MPINSSCPNMQQLPEHTQEWIEKFVGPIRQIRHLGGGSINDVRQVDGQKGSIVIKLGHNAAAIHMFEAEAKGLRLLAQCGAVHTPQVLGMYTRPPILALGHISRGQPSRRFWVTFGEALAQLHRHSAPTFGLPHDNYIGTLPQQNRPTTDGPTFYRKYRLEAQLHLPGCQQWFTNNDLRAFERLFARLEALLPDEPPALIHGDLWSGNFLCNSQGQAVLIDPAVCYAYREMDIAMAHLFGGFDPVFFEAYAANWPHADGLSERIELFQLYYLLVHVNLFGGSYVSAVRRTLHKLT